MYIALKMVNKSFKKIKIRYLINIEENKTFFKISIFLNFFIKVNTWLSFILILKNKNDAVYSSKNGQQIVLKSQNWKSNQYKGELDIL